MKNALTRAELKRSRASELTIVLIVGTGPTYQQRAAVSIIEALIAKHERTTFNTLFDPDVVNHLFELRRQAILKRFLIVRVEENMLEEAIQFIDRGFVNFKSQIKQYKDIDILNKVSFNRDLARKEIHSR